MSDQGHYSQADDIHTAAMMFARKAQEALESATSALAVEIPGRQPDMELTSAWALIGQGWAALAVASRGRELLDQAPGDS